MGFKLVNKSGHFSTAVTTAMYTVPEGKSAIVSNVSLFNVHSMGSTSPNFFLELQPSTGGSYPLFYGNVPGNSSTVIEDMLTLGSQDILRIAFPSGTPALDWLVAVLERE